MTDQGGAGFDGHEPLVLGGAPGPEVHLLAQGGTVDRVVVTGGDGVRRDVALRVAPAVRAGGSAHDGFAGCTIGRYANRIAAGTFPLDGRTVRVSTSDRGNSLHGGPDGFDRRRWEVLEADADHALLRLVSPDGDQGFPGEVIALARYAVEDDALRLDLSATTDAPTVVNLTSHLYWNLDGTAAQGGTIDEHRLAVAADAWTPVDDVGIPTGGHEPVAGTPFDLRDPRRLADVVAVDHNLVLRGTGLRDVATLDSPATRTRMTLACDRPGLQVYTGDALPGGDGPAPRTGLALEPQLPPDSPNHVGEPGWPSPVLRPGETWTATVRWRFGALDPSQ